MQCDGSFPSTYIYVGNQWLDWTIHFSMLPVALAALVALCVLVLVFRRPSHPLPPGPRGLPILGNMAGKHFVLLPCFFAPV